MKNCLINEALEGTVAPTLNLNTQRICWPACKIQPWPAKRQGSDEKRAILLLLLLWVFFSFLFFSFYVCILPLCVILYVCVACMCLCTTCMQYLQRPEEGILLPGTEVTEGREPLCGCWQQTLGPLVEQPEFLNTEPSLQPGEQFLITCLF